MVYRPGPGNQYPLSQKRKEYPDGAPALVYLTNNRASGEMEEDMKFVMIKDPAGYIMAIDPSRVVVVLRYYETGSTHIYVTGFERPCVTTEEVEEVVRKIKKALDTD
jgi:hypothetical protein